MEGLDKTIQAEVIYGGSSMPLALSARFGQPGAYNAFFIPTKAGTYISTSLAASKDRPLTKSLSPGQAASTTWPIPARYSSPLRCPQLRMRAAQIKAAQDAASGAQTIAYIGAALGVIGIVLGGMSFMRKR